MRILRFFRFYAAILAAAFCTACADEDFTDSPTDSGEAVSLTSTKLHVITRAGDEIETFYPGTVYRLFAVQHAVQEADYKWSAGIKSDGDAAIMYGMTGRESEDHDIVYNDGVNFNYATGSNADCLDFFAITVDNVDKDHHFEEKLPKFDSLVRVAHRGVEGGAVLGRLDAAGRLDVLQRSKAEELSGWCRHAELSPRLDAVYLPGGGAGRVGLLGQVAGG
jgi:hypothetical protein